MAALPRYRDAAEQMREALLTNLTLIGEIRASTFEEAERIEFIANRFAEIGLQGVTIDDKGNASGSIPAPQPGGPQLILVANADSIVEEDTDQILEFTQDRAIGPFIGDNAIAIAALATLPELLDRLQIRLNTGVTIVAASRTLGRGNLEGIRYFLEHAKTKFSAGICVESLQLGRLNYANVGTIRGEIFCRLDANYKWEEYGSSGSIIPMSDVINRISRIPVPSRPFTRIIIGSIEGGISYGELARETRLGFEARSESSEIIQQIRQQIEDIAEDVAAQSGVQIAVDIFSQREPGGIDISHPLVRNARAILTALGYPPVLYAATSLMSALRDASIPAVTLGITTGERRNELDEIDNSVAIAPMSAGMAQLVGMLQCMDEGAPP